MSNSKHEKKTHNRKSSKPNSSPSKPWQVGLLKKSCRSKTTGSRRLSDGFRWQFPNLRLLAVHRVPGLRSFDHYRITAKNHLSKANIRNYLVDFVAKDILIRALRSLVGPHRPKLSKDARNSQGAEGKGRVGAALVLVGWHIQYSQNTQTTWVISTPGVRMRHDSSCCLLIRIKIELRLIECDVQLIGSLEMRFMLSKGVLYPTHPVSAWINLICKQVWWKPTLGDSMVLTKWREIRDTDP